MIITTLFALAGCGGASNSKATPSPTEKAVQPVATKTPATADEPLKTENKIKISIEMQDGSVMKAELYPDIAPVTVANFTKLIDEKFFDGLIFHRVIPGFMIQGGGFTVDKMQKAAQTIKGEFKSNGFENNLKHTRGVLSMARLGGTKYDSASSQFFIMHADTPSLDGDYATFGKVTEGLDVVDKIASLQTGTVPPGLQDCPLEPPVIKTIKIDK